mmetsp:Transcript_54691/g.119900  ORF Transcript_54691/g.119900 Transcript_54691/m.119900 type:complete len:219 (+) Transcript_54691:63-719(+)
MFLRLAAYAMALASGRLLIQKDAPEFKATAVMPDDQTKEISLQSYRGTYVVLFFYPFDFTFVCPTEILAFDAMIEEFHNKGAEVLAVSTDSVHSHIAYRKLGPKDGGIGKIRYPIFSDFKKEISTMYDVLADDGSSHRGLFLIDREGKVRHQLVNDEPLGRSVDEAMRMLDSLKHFEQHGQVCPANFKAGEQSLGKANDNVLDRFENVKEYLASKYEK